jgi:hypothetical protein
MSEGIIPEHKRGRLNMTKVRLGAYLACALVPALLAAGPVAAQNLNWAPTTAITIPGKNITSFDISFVDTAIGLYVLSDRTNKGIDVIDTASNTFKATIPATPPFVGGVLCGVPPFEANDCAGPNGVLIVSNRYIWAGDGPVYSGMTLTTPSTVKVIDLFSQQTVHVIPTNGGTTAGNHRADEMCWDNAHNVVLVANDSDTPNPYISFISTTTFTVLAQIVMNGQNGTPLATNGIEQCQWNPRTGTFFLNIPEVNGPGNDTQPGAVLEITSSNTTPPFQIKNTFSINIADCAGPQGMALGPAPQILLGCNAPTVGSSNNSTVVIDDGSTGGTKGNIFAVVLNQSGSDEVSFNSTGSVYFLARSSAVGANQELGIVSSVNPSGPSNSFPTGLTADAGHAHSVAADTVHNQAYVPIPNNAGSTICGSLGGNNAQGCFAVFTPVNPD